MTKEKQRTLFRKLRNERMIRYSNSAYQTISGDICFNAVPDKLRELWYSPKAISFVTLAIRFDSDIDQMSADELTHYISNECYLIERLQDVFAEIQKTKEGNSNG